MTDLENLVRDLYLTVEKAELLASRLQERGLLAADVRVTYFRNRAARLAQYFTELDLLTCCNDIEGLFEELGLDFNIDEWRLFIDSSKRSLKAVLLHNGNKLPSIPLAYSTRMKESYDDLKLLLDSVKQEQYGWKVCADLKVVAVLMGLKSGYPKHSCFLCNWQGRVDDQYAQYDWEQRNEYVVGKLSVIHEPLVSAEKILLPPLHIKLGLMKNFVKVLSNPKLSDGKAFAYLKQKFPGLSEAKLKEGVFIGPDIRKLMDDPLFDQQMSAAELRAWSDFKALCSGFLGNNENSNATHRELVQSLLTSYKELKVHMSLKIHFLHAHLDFFPPLLGAVSDEQGEKFHQDISVMEKRYEGKWSARMLADYCWMKQADPSSDKHKRRSYRMTF